MSVAIDHIFRSAISIIKSSGMCACLPKSLNDKRIVSGIDAWFTEVFGDE